jgi:arylsulfatase A-like enzyme
VPRDARLEGVDLVPLLTAKQVTSRTLFWRVNLLGLNQRAMRQGNWKLIVEGAAPPGIAETDRLMLFDVAKDPGERNDVTAWNTALVRKLHQQILAWEKDVDAEAKARLANGAQ